MLINGWNLYNFSYQIDIRYYIVTSVLHLVCTLVVYFYRIISNELSLLNLWTKVVFSYKFKPKLQLYSKWPLVKGNLQVLFVLLYNWCHFSLRYTTTNMKSSCSEPPLSSSFYLETFLGGTTFQFKKKLS